MIRFGRQGHPFAAVGTHHPAFWFTVLDSPALLAYAREALEVLEERLAELLLAEGQDEPQARFTATLGLAAARTVFTGNARRQLAGADPAAVAADHAAFTTLTFDAVGQALAAFDAGHRPPAEEDGRARPAPGRPAARA
ncbi:hypothetical protein [Kitasatospora sp. MBT63]|uniref:hypothetical protein n=1 Tax=Kitasatospora sp. MBT63 TaxID=1444768 RepID=UPI00068C49EC|nr:hypothetical protein [Kitasatospora sp. MBT63]